MACKVSGTSEGVYVLNKCPGVDDAADTYVHELGDEVKCTDRKISV